MKREDVGYEIKLGDCRESMAALPESSIDAIVTDPPYELGFMGKKWDGTGVAFDVETWKQALRVLKPGGHLLAFSGTRTYHRMVCAIEDAGFEIRDQIGWVYGSGFPKSLDVSKAIDKAAGAEREVVGHNPKWNSTPRSAYTAPATESARQWQGWGTALKPAWEPIVVARKPLIGTVAANVLAHGTGALNIDGCRVDFTSDADKASAKPYGKTTSASGNLAGKTQGGAERAEYKHMQGAGRWPANLIHDGSEEVLSAFPQTGPSPQQYTKKKAGWLTPGSDHPESVLQSREYGDTGSAARFYYCAKASKRDRGDGNNHPTVKPTDLMRYLVRLVTPPGGLVLDPFMGSGSTGKAAALEGFRFVGCELSEEYIRIARARISGVNVSPMNAAPDQMMLPID